VELLSIEQSSSIRLAGELDMSSAPELDQVLEAAVEHGGAVLVDLSELTFMDSTGINAFLKAALSLSGRGCLILHGEQDRVRRVLDLVRFDGSIPNLHRIPDALHEPANGAESAHSRTRVPRRGVA
jgi:anti-sigma B factor antagonist